MGAVGKAWDAVSVSFDRFCLTAGIEALGTMMEQDAEPGLRGSRNKSFVANQRIFRLPTASGCKLL
jgi:hypothetical protein